LAVKNVESWVKDEAKDEEIKMGTEALKASVDLRTSQQGRMKKTTLIGFPRFQNVTLYQLRTREQLVLGGEARARLEREQSPWRVWRAAGAVGWNSDPCKAIRDNNGHLIETPL
jgi:hypothetical protein